MLLPSGDATLPARDVDVWDLATSTSQRVALAEGQFDAFMGITASHVWIAQKSPVAMVRLELH